MAFEPSRRCDSLIPPLTLLCLCCVLWPGCSGSEAPPDEAEKPAAQAAAPAVGGPPAAGVHGADPHGANSSGAATAAAEEKSELPPGEAPFDTTYLDVNTQLFVYAKVADILESSLVQTLTGGELGPLQQLEQEMGVKPTDIESVTIGVVAASTLARSWGEAAQQYNPLTGMGLPPAIGGRPGLGVAPASSGAVSAISPPAAAPPGQSSGTGYPGTSATAGPPTAMHSADPARGATGPTSSMHSADPARGASGATSSMHSADPSRRMGTTTPVPGQSSLATQSSGETPNQAAGGESVQELIVTVVRTRSPIDVEKLETARVDRVAHGDKAYYRQKQPNLQTATCLYLAEPATMVLADEATIKQIIDQGPEKPRPSADLGFVKALPHLLIAIAPREKSMLLKDLDSVAKPSDPGEGAGSGSSGDEPSDDYAGDEAEMAIDATAGYEDPSDTGDDDAYAGGGRGAQPALPELKPDQKLFQEHTQAVALLVDLSQGIRVDVALRSDSPEAAGKVQAEVDRNLAQVREQYEAFKGTLPGVIQQVADPLVASLAVQTSEAVVSVSTQLPAEKQSMLALVPVAVMGMMMSGATQADNEFTAMASRRDLAQKVIDEGQPATNADELPEGLQVKGLARWGESKYGEQAPPPLEIGVVVLGEAAANAIAAGRIEVTEATLGADRQLKWLGTSSDGGDGQAVTGFVPIVREGLFSDHPDRGVGMSILLAPPAEAAASLPSLAGQLMLQIAGRTDEVLLTDVQRLRGPIEDERLSSARMHVDMSRSAQGQIDISWNQSPLIGKVELVTADGLPIESAGTSTSSAGGRQIQTIALAGPPPQDLAVRVMTRGDLQEVAVPFRFENLPLPEAQELTEQQQALLVWTRGESPKDYPDLIIEAQGRWRDLELVVPQPSNPAAAGSGYPGSAGTDPSMDMEMEALDTYSGAPPDGSLEGYPGATGGRPASAAGAARPPASDEPLRIVIDLIGPLVESAEAVGEVEVTSVKSDIDTDLTFEGARVADIEGDPVESFIAFTSSGTGVAETPPGALRVVVNLTPPNQAIGGIAQLNGNLKLRTVRERTDTIISDLQSRIGPPAGDGQAAAKPITDRELNKFGLKPVIAIEATRVMMRLLEGKDERISGVVLLDHNGIPLPNVTAAVREGTGNARGRKVYAFDFPGGVPQKLGMKISVNMGVRDITIPIRLRDLPLPPPPDAG